LDLANFSNHWRLLLSGRNRGSYNMALDDAIWQNFATGLEAGKQPAPILRFYGWEPPALSLGYAQRAEREVNFKACEELGVEWIRRPTGGRAILHDYAELTYSLVGSVEDPQFSGGVLESYRKISGALVEGLRLLGVQAEMAEKDRRGHADALTSACFDAPSAYEITWQERKIIGSAQARQRGVLLQQGTILLSVDVEKLFAVLELPARLDRAKTIAQVTGRLTSIEEARGRAVSFAEAEEAFVQGFATHFGLPLPQAELTSEEAHLALELQTTKYDNLAWNMERQRPVPAFR
jgi:lipoate-protein ligase A